MKRTLLLGALVSAFLIGSVSCKKCTVAEEDTISGEIVTNSVIYASSGYLTESVSPDVFNGQQYPDGFEISFDEGLSRIALDFNSYTVLANPMRVNCKASFEKSVTRDDVNNIIRYKVIATTCESCKEVRFVENYVLVPKIPSNYTVLFEQEIIPS